MCVLCVWRVGFSGVVGLQALPPQQNEIALHDPDIPPPCPSLLIWLAGWPAVRLLREGAYFSDEQMKERQPWLHQQYVGQYTPPDEAGPSSAAGPGSGAGEGLQAATDQGTGGSGGAGMALSQSLLRHQDELEAMLSRRAEQERWVGGWVGAAHAAAASLRGHCRGIAG